MSKAPKEGAKGLATFAGSLAAQAHEHEQSAIWRTSSEPPLRELGALKERLSNIACILHEMAHDGGQSSIQNIFQTARRGSLGKATLAAARRCQSLADRRFRKRLRGLESALKNKGWNARCWSRPNNEVDSVYWPARDVAVLVEIMDLNTDVGCIEDSLAAGLDHLEKDWFFRVVPILKGYVVPALAFLPSSSVPLPDQDFAKGWQGHIDRPFLSPVIVDQFDEALAACFRLSGILTCRDPERLHPDELEVFSKSIESFERNRDHVAEAAETTCREHLARAYDYLNESWNHIVDEYEAAKARQPIAQPLCMNSYYALAGQTGDQTIDLVVLRLQLLQAECTYVAKNYDGQLETVT